MSLYRTTMLLFLKALYMWGGAGLVSVCCTLTVSWTILQNLFLAPIAALTQVCSAKLVKSTMNAARRVQANAGRKQKMKAAPARALRAVTARTELFCTMASALRDCSARAKLEVWWFPPDKWSRLTACNGKYNAFLLSCVFTKQSVSVTAKQNYKCVW